MSSLLSSFKEALSSGPTRSRFSTADSVDPGNFSGAAINPGGDFDPESDCQVIMKAMRGLGTDEKAINNIVGARTAYERAIIMETYGQIYKKDLIAELDSETSGQYRTLLLALFEPYVSQDAREIARVFDTKPEGSLDRILVEILVSRATSQIAAIVDEYSRNNAKRPLRGELQAKYRGAYRDIILALTFSPRDMPSNTMDNGSLSRDCRTIKDIETSQYVGDAMTKLIEILTSRSYHYLRMLETEYRRVTSKSLLQAIPIIFESRRGSGVEERDEVGCREVMMSILKFAMDSGTFFAEQLIRHFKDTKSRDTVAGSINLTRIILTRSEIDLKWIAQRFATLHQGTSLSKFMRGNMPNNDFRHLILVIVNED